MSALPPDVASSRQRKQSKTVAHERRQQNPLNETGRGKAAKLAPPSAPDRQELEKSSKPDTPEIRQKVADFVVGSILSNTQTVSDWSQWMTGELQIDLGTLHQSMLAAGKEAKDGDLGSAEAMLMAQAVSLNAIFTSFIHQAHSTKLVDHYERYTRLAFKAQTQCRATVETLALMKSPPVFAKQANISAGPQQVNNGIVNNGVAREEIHESTPNKLLEANGERVDEGTTDEAESRNSALEAVATINGAAHARGKGPGISKRLPRRRATEVSRVGTRD